MEDLHKTYVVSRRWNGLGGERATALEGVSFRVPPGEIVGLVGESGCGKTTLARAVLRLTEVDAGSVRLFGEDVLRMGPAEVAVKLRPKARMVFQHPEAVLNPGYSVGTALAMPLRMTGVPEEEIDWRVSELLEQVGLEASFAGKYPHELSGGEKRRVGICRALATDPTVIIADEPLSGLDVLLQERILDVLLSAQAVRGFALIVISHDLDRIHQMCARVMVMHAGRLVEDMPLNQAGGVAAGTRLLHPYSRLLHTAASGPARGAGGVSAGPPEDVQEPPVPCEGEDRRGCLFRGDCGLWVRCGLPNVCATLAPPLEHMGDEHRVACHLVRAEGTQQRDEPALSRAAGRPSVTQ